MQNKENNNLQSTCYFLKQKAAGVVLIFISILVALVDNDITAAIFLVPLGGYMLFTKKKIIVLK